jgi:hypothetical protein
MDFTVENCVDVVLAACELSLFWFDVAEFFNN